MPFAAASGSSITLRHPSFIVSHASASSAASIQQGSGHVIIVMEIHFSEHSLFLDEYIQYFPCRIDKKRAADQTSKNKKKPGCRLPNPTH
jgi:hypothetical protein